MLKIHEMKKGEHVILAISGDMLKPDVNILTEKISGLSKENIKRD